MDSEPCGFLASFSTKMWVDRAYAQGFVSNMFVFEIALCSNAAALCPNSILTTAKKKYSSWNKILVIKKIPVPNNNPSETEIKCNILKKYAIN